MQELVGCVCERFAKSQDLLIVIADLSSNVFNMHHTDLLAKVVMFFFMAKIEVSATRIYSMLRR